MNRIKNRKQEIQIQIRELKAEYNSLEQTEGCMQDILDEYRNEFESEEDEETEEDEWKELCERD